MKKITFQTNPIESGKIMEQIGTDSDGAVVSFTGRARNMSKGKEVIYLEYEIYKGMAQKELQKIVDIAFTKWPLSDCIVIHRHGRVNIGETSIFISVSSPHRDDSFKACRYIIDKIKETVPVWKKEYYFDGSKWITGKA